MATDVVMPQMGESIFEGTITKWLKKPGDKVQRDEPLFEISTDKVDAEIPAPAAGVLKEIKVKEGATVQVNTVVGVIDAEGSPAAAAPPQPAQSLQPSLLRPRLHPFSAKLHPRPMARPLPSSLQPRKNQRRCRKKRVPLLAGANGGAGTDVVMPQMGESIFEGTITKWLKKVGDKVQRDEPLFEISTDKVDAEIPAPAAGVLREIKVKEGATVQVNTVVAVIGGAGASGNSRSRKASRQFSLQAAQATQPQPAQQQPPAAPSRLSASRPADRGQDGERLRSSPLVRRMARENNVDLNQVPGTGLGGRISKNDIESFIQQHGAGGGRPQVVSAPPIAPGRHSTAQQPQQQAQTQPTPAPRPAAPPPAMQIVPGEVVPMTPMRKKIAERMVESKHTSAHVHSVFKVDMTRIARFREKNRKAWEAAQRREADVPAVHRQGFAAWNSREADHQLVGCGRWNPVSQEREHRHCRRSRLGPDRARGQRRGEPELRRIATRHRRSGRARAQQETVARRRAGRHHHHHQSRYLTARSSVCPSSCSRR